MFSDPARMRADRRKAVEPSYIAGTEPKWTGKPAPASFGDCALCGTKPDHQHGPYPLWYLAALLANRRRIIMANYPGASVGGL